MNPIYIWQRIISPHMAGLTAELAKSGTEVIYVAERSMSADRARQGWQAPSVGSARLELAPSQQAIESIANSAGAESIHICQGIRANGLIGIAQRALARRELKQWVVMETVDDASWSGILKRLEYRRLFYKWNPLLQGVLATGANTSAWLAKRGVPMQRVFPFAYFLPDAAEQRLKPKQRQAGYRFIFVGQLIERKRIDLIISAFSRLDVMDLELVVVGSGPLEQVLRDQAEALCPGQVKWKGQLPMSEISAELVQADCLILPSRHDGWGAVVSEALMAGIPAICSDRCGAAEVVIASSVGGVFSSGDMHALSRVMKDMVVRGPMKNNQRQALAQWGKALGAKEGANYLLSIFQHVSHGTPRPLPPWRSVPTLET